MCIFSYSQKEKTSQKNLEAKISKSYEVWDVQNLQANNTFRKCKIQQCEIGKLF